jgi:maltose O-acetyltransferase
MKKLKLISDVDIYRHYGVKIGSDCKIINSHIDRGHGYLIEIGNNCTLTNCTVLAHDASTYIHFKKSKVGIVKIGDNTFVGFGSIILPDVRIGKNCIIGAGCVVSKDIPDNSIVIGNPCRVISDIESFKEKHKKSMENHPVFDNYWKYKSKEEKIQEIDLLQDSYGYDE